MVEEHPLIFDEFSSGQAAVICFNVDRIWVSDHIERQRTNPDPDSTTDNYDNSKCDFLSGLLM